MHLYDIKKRLRNKELTKKLFKKRLLENNIVFQLFFGKK